MGGAAADEQVVNFHEIKFMAAPLRFEHQDECGVLVDIDFVDRVHHDPDSQFAHIQLIPRYLFVDHPGARNEVMPAAFFRLPEHPKKTEADRRKADRSEPTKRRLAKAWRLTVDTDDA